MSSPPSAYGERFFESIQAGSRASARDVLPLVTEHLEVSSVLDLGCGRGAWLAEWEALGVEDFTGVDGEYVDPGSLLVGAEHFRPHDLATPLDLGRRFDLVQSLEVAEHLPEASAAGFVESLVRHGDAVLFSAAVPGQGGKHHVNEQPLDYWRRLFAAHGYVALDPVRAAVRDQVQVEPWYRYNTLLYLGPERFEAAPEALKATALPEAEPVPYPAALGWRLRLALVRPLPVPVVTWIAGLKERWAS